MKYLKRFNEIKMFSDESEDDYDGPLFGRHWKDDVEDDSPMIGRNWKDNDAEASNLETQFKNIGRDEQGVLIGNCKICGSHGVSIVDHKQECFKNR